MAAAVPLSLPRMQSLRNLVLLLDAVFFWIKCMPISLGTSNCGQFRWAVLDAPGNHTTPQRPTHLVNSFIGIGGTDKRGGANLPFRPRGEQDRSKLDSALLGAPSEIYLCWAVLDIPGKNATSWTTKLDVEESITGNIDNGRRTNLSV